MFKDSSSKKAFLEWWWSWEGEVLCLKVILDTTHYLGYSIIDFMRNGSIMGQLISMTAQLLFSYFFKKKTRERLEREKGRGRER